MKTVLLPFESDIPVNSLVHLAYPLGIVYGSCEKRQADIYALMNHLQLVWYHDCDFPGYELVFYIPFFPYRKCFKRKTRHLDIDEESVIKTIINYIENGYYVYLIADEFYLTNSLNYNKYHNFHDLLIYGYDYDERKFNISGYNCEGSYGVRTCGFNELVIDKSCPLECIKLKKFFKPSINRRKIRKELKTYIKPLKYTCKISKKNNSLQDIGVNAVKLLQNHIENRFFNDKNINVIPFNIYLERFNILYILTSYFNMDNSLLCEVKELGNSVKIIKNMIIKYNMSHNKKILEHVILKMQDCLKREVCVIQLILEKL